jgi:hypothetical protein
MEVTDMPDKHPSIRDFIFQDMWGHILMSGPDITGYISGEKYPTAAEKENYCQGIFTMFPHMLLSGFTRWLWSEPPKDYNAFMEPSVQTLQAKVFPVLAESFQDGLSEPERGEALIPLLTDVIPKHILTGFYHYMFEGQPDYRDICDFWPQVQPILDLTARGLKAAYDDQNPMSTAEKQELFLFVGTRMPYLLLKRWYDWQFGPEKLDMPPPPQD